jgi:hypothetical protein
VKLTVTDNGGLTATKSASVTVSAAGTVLAKDDFGRTTSSGWGSTSDVGGAWTAVGGAAALSVSGGNGVMTMAPGATREARLTGVSSTGTVSTVELSADPAPAGAATHVTIVGRRVGDAYYGGRVRLEVGGVVRLYALNGETALASSYVLPDVTYTAGKVIHVKVEVSGTTPTTVKVKAWLDGASEPSGWQITATDSTSALQAAGSIGIRTVVGSASTVSSTAVKFDNYQVVSTS